MVAHQRTFKFHPTDNVLLHAYGRSSRSAVHLDLAGLGSKCTIPTLRYHPSSLCRPSSRIISTVQRHAHDTSSTAMGTEFILSTTHHWRILLGDAARESVRTPTDSRLRPRLPIVSSPREARAWVERPRTVLYGNYQGGGRQQDYFGILGHFGTDVDHGRHHQQRSRHHHLLAIARGAGGIQQARSARQDNEVVQRESSSIPSHR
jgi:hypothetical protein